ncbi:T9SS type A sorting domain-containing protein [Bergeyella sp. RCAD1439]|nr:T9SS type A sorting domain-containing protein [Bergeyella sp. RCAD1439]
MAIGLLMMTLPVGAQYVAYIGPGTSMAVNNGTLVYNGGGLKADANSTALNMGNMMVMKDNSAAVASRIDIDNSANFRLVFGRKFYEDTTFPSLQKNIYGQLYISGIPQASITGKVVKEYMADVNHSTTGGSQQIGLPFYDFTLQDLNNSVGGYLNLTNGTFTRNGRWAPNSVFRWNNIASRFDQVVGGDSKMGNPTDYFIVPVQNSLASMVWTPDTDLKEFKGVPVGDAEANTNAVSLLTSTVSSFGVNGASINYYRERYNSYLNDVFESVKWSANYGKRMSQFANPFLTNLDLYHLANLGLAMTDVEGISYFSGGGLNWSYGVGTTYNDAASTMVIVKQSGGIWQVGAVEQSLMIKPLGEVAIKFSSDVNPVVNLGNGRKFSSVVDTSKSSISPTGRGISSNALPASAIVKQVGVIALDENNKEIGRTYYAVSPSAVTGSSVAARLQANFDGAAIYTKEETSEGEDDYTANKQLYINEANEVDYKGKKITMVIANPKVKSLKFFVYERGLLVDQLSSGESFYIGNEEGGLTKLVTGDELSVGYATYNLYYGQPSSGTLSALSGTTSLSTVVAKKSEEWVVRFAQGWTKADVEVYSATGQLIHSAKNVSTVNDYVLPLNDKSEGILLVKVTSEKGETVLKKILK